MRANKIQEIIDEYYYWDIRVSSLECNYFADEVTLTYDDMEGNDVIYLFKGCYKSNFEHTKNYDKLKAVKDMEETQIPYFMQDVKIGEVEEEENQFLTCSINMFPLHLEIWCKDIQVIKRSNG